MSLKNPVTPPGIFLYFVSFIMSSGVQVDLSLAYIQVVYSHSFMFVLIVEQSIGKLL
jgi:hypothetical protein